MSGKRLAVPSRLAGEWLAAAPLAIRRVARRLQIPRSAELPVRTRAPSVVSAAQRLNGAAGTLAFSVLADSAIEHYRGAYENRAMYTPLVVASLSLLASGHGTRDRRGAAHDVRTGIYALAALTGVVGLGFHIYNIAKRDDGFSWNNLFYAAPVGAPLALALSGMLGYCAERVRRGARFLGVPAGRALAGLTSAGLLGTVGEVSLLHFRGAFQDPFMFLPVTVPPVASALLGAVAAAPEKPRRLRRVARIWLRMTELLGLAGVGFHIYGVGRNMGGWRNWRQNVQVGPPIPAPPSFTGLAMAGLAALDLLAESARE